MKLLLPSVRAALCLGYLALNSSAADLTGQIVITKKLAKKQVTLPAYQLRGASPALVHEDTGELNQFADIVVFLEGDSLGAGRPVRTELVQQNQRFEPQLLIIPAGSTVSFPNADPIFHNVFSLSGAKKFDLGYYPEGHTRTIEFDEPGIVQVYCHLHPNMYAAVVVTPNQWYTRPAADGRFALSDVPPGDHRLVVWHMHAGFFRRNVRVDKGNPSNVVLNIPEQALEQEP
jgi:plastocyanin